MSPVLVEMADLQAARALPAEARATRLADVRAALERLREPCSATGLLAVAPAQVCRCGFDRAVLSRVDAAGWRVAAVHAEHGDPGQARRLLALGGGAASPLGHTAHDAEAVRRRVALVVRGAPAGTSVMAVLGARSYVVAPVVADGTVVGLLHADRTPSGGEADEEDRDVLAILADALGAAVHRLGLARRVEALDVLLQEAAGGARAVLHGPLGLELDPDSPTASPSSAASAGPRLQALLTRREHEVVALMADGETNRQIAARLVVSEATVKSHVKSILRKLRATNRADAVGRYLRLQQLGT